MKHIWGLRLRAVGAVVACSMAVVACGGDNDSDDREAGSTTAADAKVAGEESEWGVLDYGHGKRRLLELDLSVGDRSTTRMTVALIPVVGRFEAPPARVSTVMSSEVVEVSEEFSTVRSTIEDVVVAGEDVPPAELQGLERDLEGLNGLDFVSHVEPSGAVVDARYRLPGDPNLTIRVIADRITGAGVVNTPIFPPEPVAEGAEWRGPAAVNLDPATGSLRVTYTLARLTGHEYRIRTRMTGSVEADGSAQGDVLGGNLSGSSTFSGSVRSIYPRESVDDFRVQFDGMINGEYEGFVMRFRTTATTQVD